MKFFLLSALIISTACGKLTPSSSNLGSELKYEPQAISTSETKSLANLCTVLSSKNALLSQSPGQTFTFDVSKRTCEEDSLSSPASMVVGLDGTHLREATNGLSFAFSDIETNVSGMMKEICSDLTALTNPKKLSSGNIMRFSLRPSAECSPTSRELCVYFETATPYKDDSYKIITKEWIKFQMDPTLSRVGFFTERRRITSALCAPEKSSEVFAALK
jgi:hypothetical protein